jgi:hypothetical protein
VTVDATELIDKARGSDESAHAAARQLAEAGVDVLPAIINAMGNPWVGHGALPEALERIYASAPVETLVRALDADPYPVFHSAMRAASARRDAAVTDALVGKLADTDASSERRAAAAEYLGNLGAPSAVSPLRDVFTEASERKRAADEPPRLAVETAVALAKLGDIEPGRYVVDLLSDDYGPTRALAAGALRIAVAPGMVVALARATNDEASEVTLVAVEALFLLRCPAAVDALLAATTSDNPMMANNARIRVNDILGSDFGNPATLADHWQDIGADWQAEKCYRRGEPFSIDNVLDLLESNIDRRNETVAEVVFTTGVRPTGGEFTPELVAQISERFDQTGILYRWGNPVDLTADVLAR